MVTRQYRVVYKRQGLAEKRKTYWSRRAAERRVLLLGPEPWLAFDRTDPDEYWCCPGKIDDLCGCGGRTVREWTLADRAHMPPIEYVRLESREVRLGPWVAEAATEGAKL